MPGMDDLDRRTTRDFTVRYALALGLVACLTIAAQVAVQLALHRSRSDAAVVNLAGRQRMLSQRLTMLALAVERDPAVRASMVTVLDEWTQAHQRLSAGSDLANAGRDNSPAVRELFTAIEPHFQAMAQAAQAEQAARVEPAASAVPPAGASAGATVLLRSQQEFLPLMERIVALYRGEAEARVARLITLELSLCALLLVVLVLEAFLVFRPAVARLRAAITEREALRERDLDNQSLQVAAETSRRIGQDLHDGLGQTLTALSFQAKAVERGADPAGLAHGLAEAIAQCRAQARRLAPVGIQAAGLEAALRELVESTTVATGVTCALDWQAPGPPVPASDDCFHIVQEALTNALRHGQPRRIAVSVGAWGLAVRDDGRGGTTAAEGFGLRSLRARAQRLGGSLAGGPHPDGGWEVRLALPVPPT